MKKAVEGHQYRNITNADLEADDYAAAIRKLERSFKDREGANVPGWRKARATTGLAVLRELRQEIKVNARARIRAAGGVI